MTQNLTAQVMSAALKRLDELLSQKTTLLMGGGGAMILAHGFPLATTDIDAVPLEMEIAALDPLVKHVAAEQSLSPDWLNPYFSTFAHTLPEDYRDRLIEAYAGDRLRVLALGKEEMLIMKCFAHRQKDVGHARALIRRGADLRKVEGHLQALATKRIPGADEALDFLDDVRDQEGK
jgi:hypothetical protein